ncbi:9870_t:CDS:2 [Diversispora eburnea]|uniref:9870_t:CDS:1 n=1 Tax=Diversispora eburnea TaxID=1213867 RepID=A0A9N8UZD5_9GLOM|nr:9870_t:CDS:2 [Diversispora eburnea]
MVTGLDANIGDDLSLLEQFKFIEGRRYPNEKNVHYFPNDEEEVDRSRVEHYICTWILDLAASYTSSTFVGVDFSPIFPKSSLTPPNAGFLRHNVLEGLPFPESSFDFVHQRFLEWSFGQLGWDDLFLEIVRILKDDGWFEIMNHVSDLRNSGPRTQKLSKAYIQCEERMYPLGKWAGRIGQIAKLNYNCAIKGMKTFLLPFMNITDEEFQALLEDSENEVNDYQTYICTYRVFGRRIARPLSPLSSSSSLL